MKDFNLQGIGMTSRRTRDRLVGRLREQGIADERVLDTIAVVPRHIFVDEALAHRAYEDSALPIGHGQTISQPYLVAAMTEAILSGDGGAPCRVLEIGTGSGYQTAILATLVEQVYTVERIGGLLQRARERLRALGVRNVRFNHGDGNLGWSEHSPFDAVMVTAGASHIPDAVMDQMADGAHLVIPVGKGDVKELKRLRKSGDAWRQETLDEVRFVPLVRGVAR
ncbi:MAG: protein-L-isoaspartate(D-aspartate) O-methyltransferase [Gammaproteobacteria bacterium]|nr:protein-L-isoaspartate(D-aspartate) O-methyltransferase [Gammaproteobacteria bacterium]